ncbi:hypothetical protein AX15_001432 [Amanita polypyramis BW_CC]|nr:hypothetical protein AX15_001432 [Amanita polypyramis BW_CC]
MGGELIPHRGVERCSFTSPRITQPQQASMPYLLRQKGKSPTTKLVRPGNTANKVMDVNERLRTSRMLSVRGREKKKKKEIEKENVIALEQIRGGFEQGKRLFSKARWITPLCGCDA